MRYRHVLVALALVGTVACDGGEQGERVELNQAEREGGRDSWSPELTARVDSGNAAYANGEYDEAKAVFVGITEDYPELGVAWFGLSMAERALGNDEAAEEALSRAESYAPGLGRMHDAATDSTQRVPTTMDGHPTVPSAHPPMDGTGEASPEGTAG